MSTIYETGEYLNMTGQTWHAEDSPWKASQILRIMERNGLRPERVAEVGCGAGGVLVALSQQQVLQGCTFDGFDISPQAIALCDHDAPHCRFVCEDLFCGEGEGRDPYDILLAIDVFEHVADYLGFLRRCREAAEFKIYHIPLDISVLSVLRGVMARSRDAMGHLHYFTAESALATLEDTGHEVIDCFYTEAWRVAVSNHTSVNTTTLNVLRGLGSKIHVPLTARVLGGYSLMVLAR